MARGVAPLLTSDEAPINPYRVVQEINNSVDHANTVLTHDAGNPRDQIMPFYKASAPAATSAGARPLTWVTVFHSSWARRWRIRASSA